ncbi:MAG: tetratricopeptide repeat protein [Chloroflexi bacterium]|nr:tetratricopeptide repeat protein [Chloroflexota bacterium]
MKKTFIYTTLFIGLALILGLLAVQPSFAQENEMQVANSLYENGRFAEAAQAYEQLVKRSVHDSAVYYNLGNAYFRQDDIGRAIFNYQRAAQLAPATPTSRPTGHGAYPSRRSTADYQQQSARNISPRQHVNISPSTKWRCWHWACGSCLAWYGLYIGKWKTAVPEKCCNIS